MIRSMCIGILVFLLSLQVCFAQTIPEKMREKHSPLKVLVIATIEKRGENFKKFLESNDLSCTVTDYNKVDAKIMEEHDVIITDAIQSRSGELRDLEKQIRTRIKDMPKTSKPLIGIGYSGWSYFNKFDICLGKVKT